MNTDDRNSGVYFTKELVDNVGSIDRVLADFFDRQTLEIFIALNQKFPGTPDNAMNQVLNMMATLEGTKQPVTRSEMNQLKLSAEQIDFCLINLEKARILRFEDETYELAHDTLANHISEKRTGDEVALLEITKLIKNRFGNYKKTKTLLNQKEIQWLENYKTKLKEAQKLSAEEWNYVVKSAREIANRRRKRILLIAGIIGILGASSIYANYARIQSKVASVNTQNALDSLKVQERRSADASYEKYLARGESHRQNASYQAAISEYEKAFEIANKYPDDQWTGEEAKNAIALCKEKIELEADFNALISAGDLLLIQEEANYIDALENYQKALNLNFNNPKAQIRIDEVKGKLAGAFEKFKTNGEIFYEAEEYGFAKKQFQQAARINANDPLVKKRLKECNLKLQK